MTAAATPTTSSAKTHREHGRCLACQVPYSVNVRQGYYVKCPKCGAANPGSLVSATIAKANTKPKAKSPAVDGRGAAPAVTPSAPSPAPPRTPKVQLAKPKSPPKKPATAAAPSTAVPAAPPAPATPKKGGFLSRLMGSDDDD